MTDIAVPGRATPSGVEKAFDEYYYAHCCGEPYRRAEPWISRTASIADHIVARLAPSSVFDAGCSIGLLVEQLRLRGVDTWGVDISDYAIKEVIPEFAPYCQQADLTAELPPGIPTSYSLVCCIEVIEHIPGPASARAIDKICALGSAVLFSSSSYDLTEPTHVNLRAQEDWVAEFAARGMLRNRSVDVSFVTPWAMLFEPSSTRPPEIVRSYERILLRTEEERTAVRNQLLEVSRQLAGALNHARELEGLRSEVQVRVQVDDGAIEKANMLAEELASHRKQLGETITERGELLEQIRTLRAELGTTVTERETYLDRCIRAEVAAKTSSVDLELERSRVMVLDAEVRQLHRERGDLRRAVELADDRTRIADENTRSAELKRAEGELLVDAIYKSETWRVGRLLFSPVRASKRLVGKG